MEKQVTVSKGNSFGIRQEYKFKKISCRVCGSKEYVILGKRGGKYHHQKKGIETTIVRCTDCGLIYPNPFPYPTEKKLQKEYNDPHEYFKHKDDQSDIRFFRKYAQVIEQYVGQKGKILDVGSGLGEFVYAMAQEGWDAIGVDISKSFVDYSRKKYGIKVLNKELSVCRFKSNTFNAVRIFALLEHIFEPKKIVHEIYRILKPGGIVWIEVPNETGLYFQVCNFLLRRKGAVVNLSPTFPPYHVMGFGKKSLTRLLEDQGLEIIKLRHYGGGLGSAGKPFVIRVALRTSLYLGKIINRGLGMVVIARKRAIGGNGK